MGTLERIRQTSPYALAAFAIIFIGFMVVSDLDPGKFIGRGQNALTAEIATVNGEDLLYRDFNQKVTERIEQMRANQKTSDEPIDEKQIRKDVWNETIDQILLKQEADKAGIFVSDGEILDVMLDNPPDFLRKNFTDSAGVFNRQVYLDIITDPNKLSQYLSSQMAPEQIQEQILNFKKDIINIEKYLREQKLSESLMALVNTSETILSPEFVKEKYLASKAVASVDFLFFDVNSITDEEVVVSNEEVKKYYDDHKQYYEQKPMRRIKFIKFIIKPSYDDTLRAIKKITKIDQDMQKALSNEAKDSIFDVKLSEYGGITSEYTMIADLDPKKAQFLDTLQKLSVVGPINLGPDGVSFFRIDDKRSGENVMVKASHILINFGNNKDSAKAEANKILKQAKSGGDFSSMAMLLSQDKGSAKMGGDLGFFGKGRMVKEFEEAAFAASPGEIVGPVESQFGFHIIKVVDKKSDEIKFSEINIKPMTSTSTTNKLFREAYSLQKQASEGTSFDTLVSRLKLTGSLSNFTTKDQPILGSEYLTHLAFENPVGTVLEPLELENQGIVVAQVSDARQGGISTLLDIEKQLRDELTHKKKLDLLEKKASQAFSKLSGVPNLKDALQIDPSFNFQSVQSFKQDGNIPQIGVDYGFSTQAFKLPAGKINKPVRGSRGYYIMYIYDRNIPKVSDKSPELYTYKIQLQRDTKQRVFYSWFAKIKENAEIEDFRHNFYKDY